MSTIASSRLLVSVDIKVRQRVPFSILMKIDKTILTLQVHLQSQPFLEFFFYV